MLETIFPVSVVRLCSFLPQVTWRGGCWCRCRLAAEGLWAVWWLPSVPVGCGFCSLVGRFVPWITELSVLRFGLVSLRPTHVRGACSEQAWKLLFCTIAGFVGLGVSLTLLSWSLLPAFQFLSRVRCPLGRGAGESSSARRPACWRCWLLCGAVALDRPDGKCAPLREAALQPAPAWS